MHPRGSVLCCLYISASAPWLASCPTECLRISSLITLCHQVLPQEVANLISEMIPEPPSKHQEAEYAYPDESAAVVTTYQREDVLANQIGGEGRVGEDSEEGG